MHDHHAFADLEIKVERARAFLTKRFRTHHLWEIMMQYLDDLITEVGKLKTSRSDLKADRDAQKARADTAEAALAVLEKQVADDEDKAKAALADVSAEVDAEAPAAPVTASVAAATTAPTQTVVVTGDAPIPVDSTLSGPGLADGTTATDVSTTTAVDGSTVSTVSLSQPTIDDHVGDQSETIVATPAAAA